MVEVCVQIFTLVTRGQFSPQIIISGRYWRYLQTWHLPPPHIIFSCNKSGFPAPGNRGGFVTTAHNYYHLDGQYPAINQYFSSAQHLSRLPGIENFIKNVNISNVYCKSSDGQDHPEKSISEFCHFYSFSVYLQAVDHGKIFNTKMRDRKREERMKKIDASWFNSFPIVLSS